MLEWPKPICWYNPASAKLLETARSAPKRCKRVGGCAGTLKNGSSLGCFPLFPCVTEELLPVEDWGHQHTPFTEAQNSQEHQNPPFENSSANTPSSLSQQTPQRESRKAFRGGMLGTTRFDKKLLQNIWRKREVNASNGQHKQAPTLPPSILHYKHCSFQQVPP